MPTSRHHTIKDVARAARVSTATVSRVLNGSGKVRSSTAERVSAALDQLGYVPNAWAQAMASTDHNRLLGFVVPDIMNPFFAAIYVGINEYARRHGFVVWMVDTSDDPVLELEALDTLQRYRAQGIILTPTDPSANLAIVQRMQSPVCLVDRRLSEDQWDLVLVDNLMGARQATQLLIDVGHRDLAIIAGPQSSTPGHERLRGFMEAVNTSGIELPSEYIQIGNFRQDSGFALGHALLSLPHPPSAIFSCNNLMTMGLLQAVHATPGAVLGETVAVVGFDDIPISNLTDPPLTVVSRPMKEMGEQAARLLLARVDERDRPQQTVVLSPQLIVQGSERIGRMLPPADRGDMAVAP